MAIAKSKGEGWTEYTYPTPEELKKPTPFNEKKSSKKISYVYRVPGKDLMMIAGFFESAGIASTHKPVRESVLEMSKPVAIATPTGPVRSRSND
jgi:hypothetical protein